MAGMARRAAVKALSRVHESGGYSHIVLDNELTFAAWPEAERALFSRLFYGTIEREMTLDYVIGRASSTPLRKMHPLLREILRTGAYQILFMERIPDSAAVNEAVSLTRAVGQPRAAGLVNAVLRRISREGAESLRALPDTPEGDSLRYSCPLELLRLWQTAYGKQRARELAASSQEPPRHYLRINTLKTTRQAVETLLQEHSISYKTDNVLQNCICLTANFGAKPLAPETKNWYYHQDRASQLCCEALMAFPGESVADVCAAPGGKSLTTAQYMENRGTVLACDLYEAKSRMVAQRAQAFGATCIETGVRDAAAPCDPALRERFDRVICDVPCSGLGVIRRKPEIRYKPLDSLTELPERQYRILTESAAMVRPGGRLQYSTCTLNPAENEQVVERFLAAHPEFEPVTLPLDACFEALGQAPDWRITLFPPVHQTDGFFIAALRKKEIV